MLKFICFTFLFLVSVSIPTNNGRTENDFLKMVSAEEASMQDSKLTAEDWKIELDENVKNGSKEFDFIQKSIGSSNLADNGHFLLIGGIILIFLSVVGGVFFSFCLYKLCKNTKRASKKKSKHCS